MTEDARTKFPLGSRVYFFPGTPLASLPDATGIVCEHSPVSGVTYELTVEILLGEKKCRMPCKVDELGILEKAPEISA